MSIARIYRWYETATPAELFAGRTWYHEARAEVCAIVDKYSFLPYVTHETVAGVVAVLSPNCSWEVNIADASAVIDSYPQVTTVSTYGRNRDKAYAILGGAKPKDEVRGPKVCAFYANLLGDDSVVTLDSHAFNAWKGYHATGSSLPGIPAGERRQAAKDYFNAASQKGETASAFQATVWLVWKRRISERKVEGY